MEIETEIENSLDTIQVKQEHTVTKDDTEESLRQKFPNVNPYEFEFLLFLKAKSDWHHFSTNAMLFKYMHFEHFHIITTGV